MSGDDRCARRDITHRGLLARQPDRLGRSGPGRQRAGCVYLAKHLDGDLSGHARQHVADHVGDRLLDFDVDAFDRGQGVLQQMQQLFPDCEIRRERFLGWTKAYVAVRPAAAAVALVPGGDT